MLLKTLVVRGASVLKAVWVEYAMLLVLVTLVEKRTFEVEDGLEAPAMVVDAVGAVV